MKPEFKFRIPDFIKTTDNVCFKHPDSNGYIIDGRNYCSACLDIQVVEKYYDNPDTREMNDNGGLENYYAEKNAEKDAKKSRYTR